MTKQFDLFKEAYTSLKKNSLKKLKSKKSSSSSAHATAAATAAETTPSKTITRIITPNTSTTIVTSNENNNSKPSPHYLTSINTISNKAKNNFSPTYNDELYRLLLGTSSSKAETKRNSLNPNANTTESLAESKMTPPKFLLEPSAAAMKAKSLTATTATTDPRRHSIVDPKRFYNEITNKIIANIFRNSNNNSQQQSSATKETKKSKSKDSPAASGDKPQSKLTNKSLPELQTLCSSLSSSTCSLETATATKNNNNNNNKNNAQVKSNSSSNLSAVAASTLSDLSVNSSLYSMSNYSSEKSLSSRSSLNMKYFNNLLRDRGWRVRETLVKSRPGKSGGIAAAATSKSSKKQLHKNNNTLAYFVTGHSDYNNENYNDDINNNSSNTSLSSVSTATNSVSATDSSSSATNSSQQTSTLTKTTTTSDNSALPHCARDSSESISYFSSMSEALSPQQPLAFKSNFKSITLSYYHHLFNEKQKSNSSSSPKATTKRRNNRRSAATKVEQASSPVRNVTIPCSARQGQHHQEKVVSAYQHQQPLLYKVVYSDNPNELIWLNQHEDLSDLKMRVSFFFSFSFFVETFIIH